MLCAVGLLAALAGAVSRTVPVHAQSRSATGAVGLLLPDNSNLRWSEAARFFVQRLDRRIPHAKWVVLNAQGSEATQIGQAETAIASGAKVLVVAPVDPVAAGSIVDKAHQKHVTVIAYDQPIEVPNVDLYAGFDPVAVGKLQGTFIAKHVVRNGRIVFINGPADDGVATAQAQGYFGDVLETQIKKHRFAEAGAYWAPAWSASSAESDMIDALFRNHDSVQGVVAANDSLAAGVIAALRQVHYSHRVWVTGSDASITGLRAVIRGKQSMTVYKPVYMEAHAAADAAAAILLQAPTPKLFNRRFNAGYGSVRSALFRPAVVMRSTIRSTVLKDKFVTRKAICTGIEKLCKKFHI